VILARGMSKSTQLEPRWLSSIFMTFLELCILVGEHHLLSENSKFKIIELKTLYSLSEPCEKGSQEFKSLGV